MHHIIHAEVNYNHRDRDSVVTIKINTDDYADYNRIVEAINNNMNIGFRPKSRNISKESSLLIDRLFSSSDQEEIQDLAVSLIDSLCKNDSV